MMKRMLETVAERVGYRIEGLIGKIARPYFIFQIFMSEREIPHPVKLAQYYVLGKALYYDKNIKSLSRKKPGGLAVELAEIPPETFQESISDNYQNLIHGLGSEGKRFFKNNHSDDLRNRIFELARQWYAKDIVESNGSFHRIKEMVNDLATKNDLSDNERISFTLARMLRGYSVDKDDRIRVINFLESGEKQSVEEINRFVLTTERLFKQLKWSQNINDQELEKALESYRKHTIEQLDQILQQTRKGIPNQNDSFNEKNTLSQYISNINFVAYTKYVNKMFDATTKKWENRARNQKYPVISSAINVLRQKGRALGTLRDKKSKEDERGNHERT